MSNLWIVIVASVFFVITVWLIALTVMYIKSVRHYKKFSINDGESLESAINTIFKGLDTLHESISSVKDKVDMIEADNRNHVQRVAIKRFNPYGDVGGDQSFSMAMLNAENDGIVVSSLHGRSGTRVYAKPVESGKQAEYELSNEESDVVNLAMKT